MAIDSRSDLASRHGSIVRSAAAHSWSYRSDNPVCTRTLSIRYTERLSESGIEPSVGSRGDSYDNALAESVIGLYKTEVIRKDGPWKGVDDVAFATLDWVSWFNEQRRLGPIGDIPPAEFEQMYYLQQQSRLDEAGLN